MSAGPRIRISNRLISDRVNNSASQLELEALCRGMQRCPGPWTWGGCFIFLDSLVTSFGTFANSTCRLGTDAGFGDYCHGRVFRRFGWPQYPINRVNIRPRGKVSTPPRHADRKDGLTVLGAVAELERSLICERVWAGLKAEGDRVLPPGLPSRGLHPCP